MVRIVFLFFTFETLLSFGVQAQTATIFFPNDRQLKTIIIPEYEEAPASNKPATSVVDVDFSKVVAPVPKYIYGTNANVYMSQVVDQPGLIKSLQRLSPNVIRFPGGSISGLYFFNAGKGEVPIDAPPMILDASGKEVTAGYWFGRNPDSWTLSIDNYYKMLGMTTSTGIITVNYDYARYSTASNPVASAAHLAAEWVRYDNGRTRFWEVGNESYGTWQSGYNINTASNKDSQPAIISGALYGKHFKVFADSMRKAATEKGTTIYIGSVLKEEAPAPWWNATEKSWNSGVFQEAANSPDFYIVHSYYTPYASNSSAEQILNSAAIVSKNMYDYVSGSVSAAGLEQKPIALTEWNIFAEGSKQQVSFINGMHAVLVLGETIKNKYAMAMRWDLANGWANGNDHGMFNAGDEPGGIPRWNPRPAFYYMYYFQKFFGDQMVESSVSGNGNVIAYGSTFSSGPAGIVVVNKGTDEQTVSFNLKNFGTGTRFYYHTLTGSSDNGDFSLKVNVNGVAPTYSSGGPVNPETIKAKSTIIGGGVKITLPARAVCYILVEKGTNVITGVGEERNEFRIYPNPSSGEFRADIPPGDFKQLTVIGTTGHEIMSYSIAPGQTTIHFRHQLSKGIYVVKLSGGGEDRVVRVLVE